MDTPNDDESIYIQREARRATQMSEKSGIAMGAFNCMKAFLITTGRVLVACYKSIPLLLCVSKSTCHSGFFLVTLRRTYTLAPSFPSNSLKALEP